MLGRQQVDVGVEVVLSAGLPPTPANLNEGGGLLFFDMASVTSLMQPREALSVSFVFTRLKQ